MGQSMVVVEPKPGDLIEIHRGIYQHWAIYVGDGYIIHHTTENKADSNCTTAIVKKEKLLDVAGGNKYHINNLLDKKYEPRNVSNILNDAESLVGQELPYSLTKRNCEHFLTKLRYGMPECPQVHDAVLMAAGVGVVGMAAGLLAAAAIFGSGREERRNN